MAKNHGSQIHHWRACLLFSSIISILISSCAETIEPNIEWISIPKGTCEFGTNNELEEDAPSIEIEVNAFQISSTPITNEMFAHFVEATNYVTEAETAFGSAYLSLENEWKIEKARNWRHPNGSTSDYKSLLKHPVVCVTYNDALAYCDWANVRLPSEIEWEYACELGKTTTTKINIAQTDKSNDKSQDTYLFTSPVKAFPSNSLGLYDMLGNVWEICEDNYHPEIHEVLLKRKSKPSQRAFLGNTVNSNVITKVIKGGSFICNKDFCHGYRSDARQSVAQNEAFFHIGFRVARDPQK